MLAYQLFSDSAYTYASLFYTSCVSLASTPRISRIAASEADIVMLTTSFRRSTRSRLLRATFLLIVALSALDILSLVLLRNQQQSTLKPLPDSRGQRVFIASIHWNNEKILRSNWNRAILELVEYFGADNIYVSIYESGSWDNTKGALQELDRDLESLRVRRTITLDETTHQQEIHKPFKEGWIDTPRGRKELRRIPYLAKLRNIALEPLNALALGNTKFDRVLFLNDVIFTVCSTDECYWHRLTRLTDGRRHPAVGNSRWRVLSCMFARLRQTTQVLRYFCAA